MKAVASGNANQRSVILAEILAGLFYLFILAK